ncbi:eukaryotic translation initiation factor 5 [Mitosporidium daphniae]
MPAVQSKIEGKGNGIKTVIPNMMDIARALNRPASWPTKFFGSELGAQVICDDKSNRYIVNGTHEASRLQEILYQFITKYVLCGNCSNPETDLILDDASMINSICKACGEKRLVDNRHKIAAFIQKAVPTLKAFKAGQHAAVSTGPSNAEKEDADSQLANSFESNLNLYQNGCTNENDEDELERVDPYELLGVFVSENPDATSEEILRKIDELEIKPHYSIAVLVQVALENISDDKAFMELFSNKIPIWKDIAGDKKSQKNILNSIERTLHAYSSQDSIPRKIPIYLQKLYNEDVVEEEVILEWAEKPSKTFVRDKEKSKALRAYAAPLIEWLKSAEEEESAQE